MSITKPIVLSLLLLSLAGCQAGIKVKTSHAADFDFSTAKTFGWLMPPPPVRAGMDPNTLHDLIQAELAQKGLKYSADNPTLLVAVHRSIEGTLNTQHWGYEVKDGHIDRYAMQEGTLVVDIVSAASRENVWRGTAHGPFRFDSLPEERIAMVRDVLRDMFKGFPPAK